MKVLIADKLAEEGINILKQSGFDVDCKIGLDKDTLKKIIKDYQAIIVRSQTKIMAEIIENADNLRVIGRAGVGVDNVDIEVATKKGIIVMNAPGGNTISTCEHTFALILSLIRKIPQSHNSLKSKEWKRSKFKGTELYSKTMGIIGLGRIGKEVAKRALAFGMKVLAYDPFIHPEFSEKLGVNLTNLDNLLANADIITIHTPLTDDTRYLIGEKELNTMKPSAFIINCARGGIIKESALYNALVNKKIAGAALDVFENEPPLDSKLLSLDNIVVTPHLGASTEEAQINVAVEIANCVKDALKGEAIRNAVNFIQIEPEVYKILYPYIQLSEKMGKFITQIIKGAVKNIKITYIGEIAEYKVDPLGMSFIKGFLSPILEENINFINALRIAQERGINIEQAKIRKEEEYVNLVRVSIETDEEERILEGTLFANKEPRFVKIDDVYIEIAPSPYMLLINNKDKPGVIGNLGTLLGNHNINIANMSLGRKSPQGMAITLLNVDSPLGDDILKKILNTPNIISVKFIKL